MADITRYVAGLPELRAKLMKLPGDLGRKSLGKGPAAGARVMKGSIRAHMATAVHRRSGTLSRAVIINYRRRDSNDTQQVYVVLMRTGKQYQARRSTKGKTIASTDAYYAGWVERGHAVVARHGKAIGRYPNGTTRYAGFTLRARRTQSFKRVPPHEYFGPGVEAAVTPAINAMRNAIAADLAKYHLEPA